MDYKDKELIEEVYTEMLDEGRLDQFRAKGAGLGSHWKGKTFSALGKMPGSDTFNQAGEEFADKATQQRTDYLTNKFIEFAMSSYTDSLKEAKQELSVVYSEVERKRDDMMNDFKDLNLTDAQRDAVNERLETVMQNYTANIQGLLKTIDDKVASVKLLQNSAQQQKLTTPAPVKPESVV